MTDSVGIECRICRMDAADIDSPMCTPCRCHGSIEHVHQSCLEEWLKYNKKETCELCGYQYQFEPKYRENAPAYLNIFQVMIASLHVLCWKVLPFIGRILCSLICWLVIVPVSTAWLYRVFIRDSNPTTPTHKTQFEIVVRDTISGITMTVLILISFVLLMSFIDFLRFQRIRGAVPGGAAPPGGGNAVRMGLGRPGRGVARERNGGPEVRLPWAREAREAVAAGGGAEVPRVPTEADNHGIIDNAVRENGGTPHLPRNLDVVPAVPGDNANANNNNNNQIANDNGDNGLPPPPMGEGRISLEEAHIRADLAAMVAEREEEEEIRAAVAAVEESEKPPLEGRKDGGQLDLEEVGDDDDDDDDDDDEEEEEEEEDEDDEDDEEEEEMAAELDAADAEMFAAAGIDLQEVQRQRNGPNVDQELRNILLDTLGIRGPFYLLIRNVFCLLVFNTIFVGIFASIPYAMGSTVNDLIARTLSFYGYTLPTYLSNIREALGQYVSIPSNFGQSMLPYLSTLASVGSTVGHNVANGATATKSVVLSSMTTIQHIFCTTLDCLSDLLSATGFWSTPSRPVPLRAVLDEFKKFLNYTSIWDSGLWEGLARVGNLVRTIALDFFAEVSTFPLGAEIANFTGYVGPFGLLFELVWYGLAIICACFRGVCFMCLLMLQAANQAILNIQWQETLVFTLPGPLSNVLQCEPFLSVYTTLYLTVVVLTTSIDMLIKQCYILGLSVYIAANDHVTTTSGLVGDLGVQYANVTSLLPSYVVNATVTSTPTSATNTAIASLLKGASDPGGVSQRTLSPKTIQTLWSAFLTALPNKQSLYEFYSSARGADPAEKGVLSSLSSLLFKGAESTVTSADVGVEQVCSTTSECVYGIYLSQSQTVVETIYYVYERITYWSIRLDKAVHFFDVFKIIGGYFWTLSFICVLYNALFFVYCNGDNGSFMRMVLDGFAVVCYVAKVGCLLCLRILLMPILLGSTICYMYNLLAQHSLDQWLYFMASDVNGSFALCWSVGISYMLTVTLSVLQLREILHPAFLGSAIRPQEAHIEMLGSLLWDPLATHIRRFFASLAVYVGILFSLFMLPILIFQYGIHIYQTLITSRLGQTYSIAFLLDPEIYRAKTWYNITEIQLPLELALIQCVFLTLVEKRKNIIGKCIYWWLLRCCKWWKVHRCILPCPIIEESPKSTSLPGTTATGGGPGSTPRNSHIVMTGESMENTDFSNSSPNGKEGEVGKEEESNVRLKVGRPLRRPPPGWDSKRSAAETHRWAWGDEALSSTERGLASRAYPPYWYFGVAGVVVSSWFVMVCLLGCLIPLPLFLGRLIFYACSIPSVYTHDLVALLLGQWALYGLYTLVHRPWRIGVAIWRKAEEKRSKIGKGAKSSKSYTIKHYKHHYYGDNVTGTDDVKDVQEKRRNEDDDNNEETEKSNDEHIQIDSAYRHQQWSLYRAAILRWVLQLGVAFLSTGSIYLHCCTTFQPFAATDGSLSYFSRALIVGAVLHLFYVTLVTSSLPTQAATLLSLDGETINRCETVRGTIIYSLYQPNWFFTIRQVEDTLCLYEGMKSSKMWKRYKNGTRSGVKHGDDQTEVDNVGTDGNGWKSTGINNISAPSHAAEPEPITPPRQNTAILDAKLTAITTFEDHVHNHSPLTLNTLPATTQLFAPSMWGMKYRGAGLFGMVEDSSVVQSILLSLLSLFFVPSQVRTRVDGEREDQADLYTSHQRYSTIIMLLLLIPLFLPVLVRVVRSIVERIHRTFYDTYYLEGRKLSNLAKPRPREGSVGSTD